ncbi:amidophosphoribosyltransferase [Bradyrhizobium elkanii]|uniref:hypothetical protein n=1 Tax=Bradyrhizobium elkanii TaxID=29448 RepID=UPI00216700DF|nr:hypothetical protein [Bradyrhizobium elkanii]MCS3689368.1 glutamine phosphoribosylpyrophosphate amidotransferase [Bradyrhizobium elkanii]
MSGIAAAFLLPWSNSHQTVYDRLARMLAKLALRGQAGVGVAAFMHNNGIRYKSASQPSCELSAIDSDEQDLKFNPHVAIAHVRGRTCSDGESDDQPSCNRRANTHQLAMFLDGALANAAEVRAELATQGHHLGRTDAEPLPKLVEHICERDYWRQGLRVDYENVFREVDERIDGAISALLLDAEGNLIAFRNRYGLRPLEFMQTDDGFLLFASENCAFAGLQGESDQILPGSIKYVDGKKGSCHDRSVTNSRRAAKLCAYETLYIGSPETSIQGRSHLETRYSIGFSLGDLIARRISAPPDGTPIIVSSMPHTGGPYADGLFSSLLARGVRAERREVIETQMSERTLIGPSRERKQRIAHKYRLTSIDVDKRTILIADEALIRGDTSRTVTSMLLSAGVKAVHWGIGSPPVVAPNYYGVNIENIDELAFWQTWKGLPAQQRKQSLLFKDIEPHVLKAIEAKIAASINAATVTYLPFPRLTSLLPRASEGMDLSPFTFEMPTPAGQKRANRDLHNLVADRHGAA